MPPETRRQPGPASGDAEFGPFAGRIFDQRITHPLELTRERFEIGADGRIQVPEKPGLGVSLDPATMEKFRVA